MVPIRCRGCCHDLLLEIRYYLLKLFKHGHPNLPLNREIEVHAQLVVLLYLLHPHILVIHTIRPFNDACHSLIIHV